MLQIAICDDNVEVCTELEKLILEYAKINNIKVDIEVFNQGDSLIQYIEQEHKFDLILLDIELGDTTGVFVGEIIRNKFRDHISKIIFISGVSGYEMELFNLQPLNFLRKPVDKNKLFKCIDLAREIFNITTEYFEYKINYATKKVPFKDIIYFESSLRKIIIHTTTSQDEIYNSLVKIKLTLPRLFVIVHQSFIVNFEHVVSIEKSELTMSNGDKIPISQRKLKNIRTIQLAIEKEKRDVRL